MRRIIKRKAMWIVVIAIIVANVFFSTVPDPTKQSQLSLALLQAKADGTIGETDIPDPEDPVIPFRQSPRGWSLSVAIDDLFK